MKDKVLSIIAIIMSTTILGIYLYNPSVIMMSRVGFVIIMVLFLVTGYCLGALLKNK